MLPLKPKGENRPSREGPLLLHAIRRIAVSQSRRWLGPLHLNITPTPVDKENSAHQKARWEQPDRSRFRGVGDDCDIRKIFWGDATLSDGEDFTFSNVTPAEAQDVVGIAGILAAGHVRKQIEASAGAR